MNKVILSLGTNLGDKIKHLQNAVDSLQQVVGKIETCSSIYESEAWGFESISSFFNLNVSILTKLTPQEILTEIKKIENEIGRVKLKKEKYEDRTIDIDIIAFNTQILTFKNLEIPHKEYIHRKFVLLPLYEIEPHWIDPKTNVSIEKLIHNCSDESQVMKRLDCIVNVIKCY
jgi:2-amino-4-hydroxy-6-hydroxymethyldihydropteridine diphosphokinase